MPSDTPITDAVREHLKDPENAQAFADAGNALAAGLQAASQPEPLSPIIPFEDFAKVKLQFGKVVAAEPVPKAKKLLKLTVNFCEEETRTILAGIALTYRPEDLIGNTYLFVTNLAPRVMMGVSSHGMILAASTGLSGVERHALLTPNLPVMPGAEVR